MIEKGFTCRAHVTEHGVVLCDEDKSVGDLWVGQLYPGFTDVAAVQKANRVRMVNIQHAKRAKRLLATVQHLRDCLEDELAAAGAPSAEFTPEQIRLQFSQYPRVNIALDAYERASAALMADGATPTMKQQENIKRPITTPVLVDADGPVMMLSQISAQGINGAHYDLTEKGWCRRA